MGHVPILSENRQAIKIVYMIEAESIVRSQNTLKNLELAGKLLKKYKQLIVEIPSIHVGEFGMKELMSKDYFIVSPVPLAVS